MRLNDRFSQIHGLAKLWRSASSWALNIGAVEDATLRQTLEVVRRTLLSRYATVKTEPTTKICCREQKIPILGLQKYVSAPCFAT